MGNEGERCPRCGAETTGARCSACLEADHPPILERGGKWSPLEVAGLSIVCDPLMIPTIIAIARAVRELREAGRRESLGLYREEHARVRTGALWAILITAARPLFVALVFLSAGVSGALTKPMHPVLPADELGEILERARSEDQETRILALGHLEAIAPALTPADIDRALDAIEAGFGHDALVEGCTRVGVLGAIASSPLLLERSERVARLYPTLDPDGREQILERYAEIGTRRALAELASLAGGDHDPEGPVLPQLLVHGSMVEDADVYLGPLVSLPAGASLRASVPLLLSVLCEDGLDGAVLEPLRERLIADWLAMREPLPPASSLEVRTSPDHRFPVSQARHQLAALRCLEGADVDALLREAGAHPDARVAAAAVRTLLARGLPVSRAAIARIAADPLARADLFETLLDHEREHEIPRALRTERALAEAQLLSRMSAGTASTLIDSTWLGRFEPRPDAGVHVFAVTVRDLYDQPGTMVNGHVAIGLYPELLEYPEMLETFEPYLREHDEEGGAFDPAALAAELVNEQNGDQVYDEPLVDLLNALSGDPL